MITNHWGIYVDSEVAITGVVSNNTPEWLMEEVYDGIDLSWEEYQDSLDTEDEDYEEQLEQWESDPSDTILIGDWIKDEEGYYNPDPEGEYAAIVREDVTQVVYSHNLKRTSLCSPCYPGQGDLDSTGDYLTYDLPESIYGKQGE